jgi:hypothetical protein
MTPERGRPVHWLTRRPISCRAAPRPIGYVPAMTYRAVLRGYLLEESLAWLLRNAGYRLLVRESDDEEALKMDGQTLMVKGRGAVHQVDVLGEFELTPAFSLPVRMFLEAKYTRDPCDLPVVRNAHGVIHDVNENFVLEGGPRPRRRFQYAYALFSAKGFTGPAQDYALAQQISLVDLSGPSFGWLRRGISAAASQLYSNLRQYGVKPFPVMWMRHLLRARLHTDPNPGAGLTFGPVMQPNDLIFRSAAESILHALADELLRHEPTELLLGFPAAPFILPFGSNDPAGFVKYANQHPTHGVRLRFIQSRQRTEWWVSPWDAPTAYKLVFNLPERLEDWIVENEERRARRAAMVKSKFLPTITIYRRSGPDLRVYQLRYEPSELHRRPP